MNQKVNPNRTLSRITILFLLYPPAFSMLFGLVGLSFPSYLFCAIVALFFLVMPSILPTTIRVPFTKQNSAAILLILWIFASAIYTESQIAWQQKAVQIMYLIVMPSFFIYLAYLTKSQGNGTLAHLENSLFRHSKWLLLVSSASLFLFAHPGDAGRLTMPGIDHPIWVGRYFGLLSVIVLCRSRQGNWRGDLLHATLALLALVDMVIIGARGAFLALLLVLIIYHYRRAAAKAVLKLIFILSLALMAAFIVTRGYIFETDLWSIYDRVSILSTVEDSIPPNLLIGWGIGSFGIVTLGQDYVFYPHNIFVELFFEQGFIGLMLFLVLIIMVVKKFMFNSLGYLIIFFFINSLVSGDISGNNYLFILAFVAALPLMDRNSNHSWARSQACSQKMECVK